MSRKPALQLGLVEMGSQHHRTTRRVRTWLRGHNWSTIHWETSPQDNSLKTVGKGKQWTRYKWETYRIKRGQQELWSLGHKKNGQYSISPKKDHLDLSAEVWTILHILSPEDTLQHSPYPSEPAKVGHKGGSTVQAVWQEKDHGTHPVGLKQYGPKAGIDGTMIKYYWCLQKSWSLNGERNTRPKQTHSPLLNKEEILLPKTLAKPALLQSANGWEMRVDLRRKLQFPHVLVSSTLKPGYLVIIKEENKVNGADCIMGR